MAARRRPDRRGHRADRRHRPLGDPRARALAARSGASSGWRGARSIPPSTAGSGPSTAGATCSTAPRSTSWSTAPTSSCTSRSSSSAAATRPREINLEGLAQRVRGGRRRGRTATRLHVVGGRVRLPRRQPRRADRGHRAARDARLLLLGPEGRAGGAAGRGGRRARTPTPTSSAPASSPGATHRRWSRASPVRRSSAARVRQLWRALDAAAPDRTRAARQRVRRSSSCTTTMSPRRSGAAVIGQGPPGTYNLAGDPAITVGDVAPRSGGARSRSRGRRLARLAKWSSRAPLSFRPRRGGSTRSASPC